MEKKNEKDNQETFGFTLDIQKKIVSWLLAEKQALEENIRLVRPEYFDSPVLREIMTLIIDFFNKYSRPPTESELQQELDSFLETDKRLPSDEYLDVYVEVIKLTKEGNFDYVRDKLAEFVQFQRMKGAILEAGGKDLEKRDYKAIQDKIRKAALITEEELKFTVLSDIERKPTKWLWPNRIPIGKLTLVVGDPDVGKSFWSAFLASHVSKGKLLPHCSSDIPAIKGGVLMLSAEDDPEDTIAPRIDLCGGDDSKIEILEGTRAGKYFNLSKDIPKLEESVKKRNNVKLIIIDPISAYFGKAKMNDTGEMRSLLSPLKTLAEKYDLAIVAIAHLNKNESTKAIYRISGAVGIVAAARTTWLVMNDENDENNERRLLCCLKMNVAKKPKGAMVFRIWEREDKSPGFEFTDEIADVEIGELLTGETEKISEAMDLIKLALKSESKPSTVVYDACKVYDISKKTALKAAKKLGVEFGQKWDPDKGKNYHEWSLVDEEKESETETPGKEEKTEEDKKIKPTSTEKPSLSEATEESGKKLSTEEIVKKVRKITKE